MIRLPELFEEIIRHDQDIEEFKKSLGDVIPLEAARVWKDLKERKRQLVMAAERYIAESKKDA